MAKLDRSKYSYIEDRKLDDLYLTEFMREIWSVPADKLSEYFAKFYPRPTALELVEINQMISLIKKISKKVGEGSDSTFVSLTDEEQKLLEYKHRRMFGRERQIVELSGREGGPIKIQEMTDEELERNLKGKLSSLAKVIKKAEKK